jgi:hypothetical protein
VVKAVCGLDDRDRGGLVSVDWWIGRLSSFGAPAEKRIETHGLSSSKPSALRQEQPPPQAARFRPVLSG